MPCTITELAAGNIVSLTLTGKLTADSYDIFVPELNQRIEQHGKLRLLVELHDFHGWTAGALWEDTKFAAKHFTDIERLAIVGETKWEKGMAAFCKPFTAAKVKYFDHTEKTAAEHWIAQHD